jgi:hypothetical protein
VSADNWAICPRCKAHRKVRAAEAHAAAHEAYGLVPISEFEALREKAQELTKLVEADTVANRTLREDYEFFGAEDGTVTASYRCSCTVCGLSSKFEYSHELPE